VGAASSRDEGSVKSRLEAAPTGLEIENKSNYSGGYDGRGRGNYEIREMREKASQCLRTKATSNVTTQVDRLKVDRLKEKTCGITIALQSSASTPEWLGTFAHFVVRNDFR
jgi:hypothetical protein